MTDVVLEYDKVSMEYMGHLNPGRMKFTDQSASFKTTKSGRLDQIYANDIDKCEWIRLGNQPAIRILLKNGNCFRFGGFTEQDFEKLGRFMDRNWKKQLSKCDQSVRGWNFGNTKFEGSTLRFDVENENAFEVPLQNVSNCTTAKNEVTLEFHQNDECPVSLMEIRFHIPTTETGGDAPVEEFRKNVVDSAGIIQETGRALATLEQVLCSTPRGRYDIKIYPSFLALHGKTFDYKIPISTILRLFLLPHKDGRRMYFVVSLDPPIKQGQTRYHFLILEFMKDEEVELEIGLSEDALKKEFEGQLTKQLKGPLFEVVSRIMKTLVKKRITVPGSFVGHSGTPAISCALKQSAGFLYPLEKGFMYVHKPPIHIRSEEIASVNFARSDVSTRSFDFEIETKSGNVFTFTSIEKEEYSKLYDFVNSKHLRIRNVNKKSAKTLAPQEDFFVNSDDEGPARDPYAAKLKQEAKEREEEEDDNEDSEESEDSDYNPNKDKTGSDEPEEEFDSDAASKSSSSDEEEEGKPKKSTKPKPKRKKDEASDEGESRKSSPKKSKEDKGSPDKTKKAKSPKKKPKEKSPAKSESESEEEEEEDDDDE